MCVCVCRCVFGQYFFVNTSLIKHERHFLSTYFFIHPFKLPPYEFYDIRRELVNKPSIVNSFPNTFGPRSWAIIRGCVYCKSDVTFAFILLLCKNLTSIVYSYHYITYFQTEINGYSYLLTPPLGQVMTQGQFLTRSLTGLNSEFSFS